MTRPKLIIENTNHCNAQCVICPHFTMKRKKGVMSMELYQKVIDEAVKLKIRYVQINATGEPLLDPMIIQRIKYAKERGIPVVYLFTNGSLLSEKTAQAIIKSGLDVMKISVDDFRREEYEQLRKPLKFDDVIKNIIGLIELKYSLGSGNPSIIIEMKPVHGDKQAIKATELYNKLKDKVSIVIHSQNRIHDWAGQHKTLDALNEDPKNRKRLPCSRLWNDLNVLWDGRACLCCLDYEGKEIIGDLNSESIQEVWWGAKLKKFRELHKNGQDKQIDLCKYCRDRSDWIFV